MTEVNFFLGIFGPVVSAQVSCGGRELCEKALCRRDGGSLPFAECHRPESEFFFEEESIRIFRKHIDLGDLGHSRNCQSGAMK